MFLWKKDCILCDNIQIEDGFHAFVICNMYTDIRNSFLNYCYGIDPSLQHKSFEGVFILSMSDPWVARKCAKAWSDILDRKQCFIHGK